MAHPLLKSLTAGLVGLALLAGCARAADDKTITIGATAGDFGDMARQQVKPALEQEGYTVKVVEFSDYVTPNTALAEGSLSLNVFQHKPYLEAFAHEHQLALTPVFQVPTAPLGLYAGKLKSLAAVRPGATVAIPNDLTNEARAIVLLRDVGWLTLKPGVDALSATQKDIASNPKGLKLLPLEAAQLPRAREDADYAVINGNYATLSGLNLTDALFQEQGDTFVNWGVIRTEDRNAPWVKDVVEAYNSPQFQAWARETYPGYKYPSSWKR